MQHDMTMLWVLKSLTNDMTMLWVLKSLTNDMTMLWVLKSLTNDMTMLWVLKRCQLLVENIHITTTFELPTEKANNDI